MTVSGGFPRGVFALAAFDEDQTGPKPEALFVGGTFRYAGGLPSSRITKWSAPFPLTVDSQPQG